MSYKVVDYYIKDNGKIPYKEWYEGFDNVIRVKIDVRIKRLEAGNYGYYKNLSGGITELKFTEGIRIYFAEIYNKIILLLSGGNKTRQNDDIALAKEYLIEYKLRNK